MNCRGSASPSKGFPALTGGRSSHPGVRTTRQASVAGFEVAMEPTDGQEMGPGLNEERVMRLGGGVPASALC